jgi:threonine-phosphate decarboxylase
MRKLPAAPADLARLFRHGDRAAAEPGILLDFSVSLNPAGRYGSPPPLRPSAVFDALLQVGWDMGRYPDPDCRALTARLAWLHGVEPAQVVVGNGANDLIYAAARALAPPQAAVVEPTYTEYLRASLLAGATVAHWLSEGEDFRPGPFDPGRANLVWLCNPNNPTGQLWPPGALADWIASLPGTVFVVDEAYLPFRADEAEHTLIPAVRRLANLVVLRSFTKVYALPGLRLGYAVSSPALAERLRAQVVPWSVNAVAQAVGAAALEDEAFLARTRAWLRETLGPFTAGLAGCSTCLRPLPSQANFVLVRLAEVASGWLARRLAERGIAVRDASNFVGLDDRYVRLSLRGPEDNQRLLRELRLLFLEG